MTGSVVLTILFTTDALYGWTAQEDEPRRRTTGGEQSSLRDNRRPEEELRFQRDKTRISKPEIHIADTSREVPQRLDRLVVSNQGTESEITVDVSAGVSVEEPAAVPVEDTVAVTNTAPGCNAKSGCVRSCVSGAKTVEFKGACVAKDCLDGHYKVKKKGGYQGWCIYISCPADQEPNIDAQEMWDQTTDKCRAKSTTTVVTDELEAQAEAESAEVSTPVVTEQPPEPCEDTNQGIQSGHIVNGICVPESCVPQDWTLINDKCVHADGIDCKDIMYMADTATYQNGVCTVHKCYARFEVKENQCVEISGPCKSLPDNATRGHREYDKDAESEKCIVDDCVDGYVVADDKVSCREDYDALAEQAREREQSTGNKLLGAVGMGATGVGGAMLMSGLAESASDDEAERAMKAYLSTFTCKYGNESVPGGTMNVEIPGGNELIQMYADYVALANDLKVRKEALGMKPGIESEAILDSATSGLYDDVSTGKTQGAYASLARALSDPNSEDAKIWATQREESDEKKKTGAITAGTGAGASLVGNIISEGVDKNKNK